MKSRVRVYKALFDCSDVLCFTSVHSTYLPIMRRDTGFVAVTTE